MFLNIDKVFPITIDINSSSVSGSIPVFHVTDKNTSFIKICITSNGQPINMLDYSYLVHTLPPKGSQSVIELEAEDNNNLLLDLEGFSEVGEYRLQVYIKVNDKVTTLAEVKYQVKEAIQYREV